MHSRKNCQRHLWLLTGTGEGPCLAKAFIRKGWKVSVSVVSYEASLSYFGLGPESLLVGKLEGVEGISAVLENADKTHKRFDCIIDATHPFACEISANLKTATSTHGLRLIRYECFCENFAEAKIIKSFEDLANFNLAGQKLLLAIGSKYLSEAVIGVRNAGAIPFARVLPRVGSLTKSLSSQLPEDNLAVLQPIKAGALGLLEEALCRKWSIDGVLCRQSGGLTQEIWQSICSKQKIDLFMIARPSCPSGIEVANTLEVLFKYLDV